MALSDTTIRNAKPAEKTYVLRDGGGLNLFINPTGSKLWRLKYRNMGKERTLSIGAYPAVSLAKARQKREEAKALLVEGIDPSFHKRTVQKVAEAAAANTFKVVAEDYIEKLVREGRADKTLEKVRWMLGFVYPDLGHRPVADIKPAEVLAVLRKQEARGIHHTAVRLRSTIGAVFRFAVATTRAETNPTDALKGALTVPVVKHRAAVTDSKAIGALMRAIDGFDGQPTTKAALQLMAILFPRPGELRMAEWCEFDLAGAVWTIPAARTKMRREHKMHLPKQALVILNELQRFTGNGKLVFPSVRTVLRPISENTLNAALRRLGYTTDEATAHGFRATASTLLNESGFWHADAIERQLAHVEGNDVRRAYARGDFWDERVRMMDWWASYLDAQAGLLPP